MIVKPRRIPAFLAAGCLLAVPASALAEDALTRRAPMPKPAGDAAGDKTIPCPEYGPKFFRSPGSRTCVKLEGQMRGEMGIRQRQSRMEDAIGTGVRADARLETRTETDYGTFRAVVGGRVQKPMGALSGP